MVGGVNVSIEGMVLRTQYPIIKNFKTIAQAPEHFFCVHNINRLANVPEQIRSVFNKKRTRVLNYSADIGQLFVLLHLVTFN